MAVQPSMAQPISSPGLQTIHAAADSNCLYSLYLPTGYSSDSSYPLLLFLDPGARGNVPVEYYHRLADENRVIFAGSFGSKNFDPSASEQSVTCILADLKSRCHIRDEAVWLAGFSGGSRMASSYAAAHEGINAVIACGAGFAGEDFINSKRRMAYSSIVGDSDMNFEEMVGIQKTLTDLHKENMLVIFKGGHRWPPVEKMALSVHWLQQQQPTASMEVSAPAVFADALEYQQSGMDYLGWLEVNELKKISSITSQSDSIAKALMATKGFNKQRELFDKTMADERQIMDGISFLFNQVIYYDFTQEPDKQVWDQKIEQVKELRESRNKYVSSSGERVFDFFRRLCLEQYSWYMEQQQYLRAYKAAQILSWLPVKNISTAYLLARAAAGLGKKEECTRYLKEAVRKNEISKERMMADQLLSNFLGDQLKELLPKD